MKVMVEFNGSGHASAVLGCCALLLCLLLCFAAVLTTVFGCFAWLRWLCRW